MGKFSGCVILIALALLMLSGCSNEVSSDQKTAKDYVEAMGYKITSYRDQVYKFTVEKETMEGTLNQQIWGVQKIKPDKYFGNEITMYSFTVSNHPLRKLYNLKTSVSIMLCEGTVIGGTSFPIGEGEKSLVGAPYSLDGKTLEEITGLTYLEWKENWRRKYGNYYQSLK